MALETCKAIKPLMANKPREKVDKLLTKVEHPASSVQQQSDSSAEVISTQPE